MTDTQPAAGGDPLHAYAVRVLAGTGLTVADTTPRDDEPEGAAAEALREGWEMARRAAKVQP